MKTLSIDIETYSSASLPNAVFTNMWRLLILRFFCSAIARTAVLFRSLTSPAVKSSRMRSKPRLQMKP
jgi:hypothetical protein